MDVTIKAGLNRFQWAMNAIATNNAQNFGGGGQGRGGAGRRRWRRPVLERLERARPVPRAQAQGGAGAAAFGGQFGGGGGGRGGAPGGAVPFVAGGAAAVAAWSRPAPTWFVSRSTARPT